MKIRTCSDCRYEKEDVSSEVCTNCHGIAKGEPSNWKQKTCLICNHFGKGIDEKPCSKCFYNKYRPSFELKQFELDKKENKEMKEIKTCNNCRHSDLNIACEPCRSCTDNESGERRNWNAPVEDIKTCSNCKHASDGLDDDICEQCSVSDRGGTVFYWEARNETESKQEEHEETRSCDTCKYSVLSANIEPCMSCINAGGYSKWEAPLDETEGNNSDTKLIRCAVCKYRYKDMDAEPCNSCVNMGRGDKCKGEEADCRECKYASVNINEEPCKNCSKNSRNSQIVSNLYFEPVTAHCYDCKHRAKCIDESPCNECCEVYMGEDCKWEGVYCDDCKYAEVDVDAEPCNKCSNNDCISKETRATLSLCFEEPESKQEDEELQEEIASHDSKQEVYNGVTPSCWTCKHFEDNSNAAPCNKCVAICNGIVSYWEERDEEIGLQTAREVVEKAVEQRLQEEHFDEHYHDKVQPLEIMQEIMTPEEFRGFLFGNIIKYSCRCGKKDEPQKEFAKLRRYKEWYDKAVLGEHIDPRV